VRWRSRFRLATIGDAIAGVSIALVLIPQSLAYARVAGVPAYVGLYAAALPPIAASFFASSPYLQTGPVAVTALLTAGALAGHAPPGSPEYVLLAGLLAFWVGLIRIAIGTLRLGKLVYLMSEPVLRGFTIGAALLIALSQLPGLLGVTAPSSSPAVVLDTIAQYRAWDLETIVISLATFAVIVACRRVHERIPWALLVTAGGIAYGIARDYGGAVVGSIPGGFVPFQFALPWQSLPALLVPGLVIALVGFAEASSIARLFAARDRQRWEPDRDFISQGAANLAAAFSSGFPVGGSFSRSMLGRLLGARTRWSGGITGLAVLAFLPFASVLSPLPVAVLSAMVITAVIGLVRVRPILSIWPLSKPQFLVAGGTFVLTILLAPRIDQAVILGILMAGAVHLWREFDVRLVSWLEDTALHIRPEGVLWFGSAEMLRQQVLDLLAEHARAERLVLHMERLGRVDLTASLALETLIEEARDAGLATEIVSVHPVTAKALNRVLSQSRPSPPPGIPSGG
jgi:SulP family sulfate permease